MTNVIVLNVKSCNSQALMLEIQTILEGDTVSKDDKERAIYDMASLFVKEGKYQELAIFCQKLKDYWSGLTGARSSKITKNIVNYIPISEYSQATLFINSMIEWCEEKGQKYLKLFFETKRVGILYELREYSQCLDKIKILNLELKKMNDKLNLISLYIYESKTYFEMQNMTRAKACLTSARALAVTTYCPFYIQAQIELLAGMYVCEDGNYVSSFSNFLEALDGFHQSKMRSEATLTIRYLILSKIIISKWTELNSILKMKNVQPYLNDEIIQILLNVSESCKNRDLSTFDKKIQENYDKIRDNFILSHLTYLKDLLLDANILKLIEPYLNVSINFIAEKLNFPVVAIEAKLRTLILDKKIPGILDYYTNTLVIYKKQEMSETEETQLEMMDMIVRNIKTNSEYEIHQ